MFQAAVLTVSDRSFRGERPDTGGPLVAQLLEDAGYRVVEAAIAPDEKEQIQQVLCRMADSGEVDLLVTTGGTGFAPRDITPEATLAVCHRLTPGIPEAMRTASMAVTNRAVLSRAQAGIRGQTLIVNLPGSPKAAKENLEAVLPALAHGLEMLSGRPANCAQEQKKTKHPPIPVFSLVGYSGSGKTTLLEKLIPWLKAAGLRVAVVKHDGHDFEMDHEGKDSWRMTRAGAEVSAIVSGTKATVMENRPVELASIIGKIDQVDLILTEGCKHGPWPKIMLHRKANGKPLPLDPNECLAVVSDMSVNTITPCFSLDDIAGLAWFLLRAGGTVMPD